jgi:hypothetical protein
MEKVLEEVYEVYDVEPLSKTVMLTPITLRKRSNYKCSNVYECYCLLGHRRNWRGGQRGANVPPIFFLPKNFLAAKLKWGK